MFISFEGIDGSGKSTQSKRLAAALREAGHKTHLTREPGGSDGAEEIRALLVDGDPDRWSPETELLLFNAARRDHLEKVIRPRIKAGEVVISDRFADSTRVYQGATRGDLRQTVDAVHQLMIGTEPDLTFVVDMDPETALSRGLARQSGEDRFEEFGLPFQRKLRAGFKKLADDFPKRVVLINGKRDEETIAAEILEITLARLP